MENDNEKDNVKNEQNFSQKGSTQMENEVKEDGQKIIQPKSDEKQQE